MKNRQRFGFNFEIPGVAKLGLSGEGSIGQSGGPVDFDTVEALAAVIPQGCVPADGRWAGKPTAAANVELARSAIGKRAKVTFVVSDATAVPTGRYTGLQRVAAVGVPDPTRRLELRTNAYFDSSHRKDLLRVSPRLEDETVTIRGWVVRADIDGSFLQLDLLGCEFVDD